MVPTAEPRAEPDFSDRVINELLRNYGRWVRLGRLLVAEDVPSHERCNAIRDAVETGRRLGLQISGDPRRGYCLTGFVRPPWSRVPGPRSWPPPETSEVPGQLRLVER